MYTTLFEKILIRELMWKITLSLFLFLLLPSLSFGSCNQRTFSDTQYLSWATECQISSSGISVYWKSCYQYGCSSQSYYSCRNCSYIQNSTSGYCSLTFIECTTQAEADSVVCIQGGKQWVGGQCQEPPPPCDSTFHCTTSSEQFCKTYTSDNITCLANGVCYGVTYSEYNTKYTTSCNNECGEHTEQSYELGTGIQFDGANCENVVDSAQTDCGVQTYCTQSADATYLLYQKCLVSESISGIGGTITNNKKYVPKITQSGKGTCSSMGYPNTDLSNLNDSSTDSTGSSGNSPAPTDTSMKIPIQCFILGIDCPNDSNGTDYGFEGNRTPENGCYCDDDYGSAMLSRIICPDGSVSYNVGSCSDWKKPESSSSEQSSSSVPPVNDTLYIDSNGVFHGDWATDWRLDSTNKALEKQSYIITQFGGTIVEQLSNINKNLSNSPFGGDVPYNPDLNFANEDAILARINAMEGNGEDLANYPSNVDSMGREMTSQIRTIADGVGSAYTDSLGNWIGKINYEKLKDGSGACPVALARKYEVNIGLTKFQMDGLGKYICSPVMGNVTPWRIAVIVLRAMVAFGCFFFLFKVVTSGGKDE